MFDKLPYNDYSSWIRKKFGERVQKISINAGFTCPNRDGNIGTGGCIYCDNSTFNPSYTSHFKSVSQQIKEGIDYFSVKYPAQKYIAYFQSYTNTYSDIKILSEKFKEAMEHPGVVGLSIATRPDCLPDPVLELLAEINTHTHLVVEIGVESTLNKTLKLINRGHSWEQTKEAFKNLKQRNILTGAHLIIGLPGESKSDIIDHAKKLSEVPVQFLKLHQLQVIKNTQLENLFNSNPAIFNFFTVEEYCQLVSSFLAELNPEIIIERFTGESPIEKVVAPKWGGKKNFEITEIIRKTMQSNGIFQGMNR